MRQTSLPVCLSNAAMYCCFSLSLTMTRRFPASAGDFSGREPATGAQTSNGRPNTEPYGFTVKVVAFPVYL